jgi:hypothetical protein
LPSELAHVSVPELRLLEAYYQLDPWGEHRADWRTARIAQVVAAVNGTQTTLADHMPVQDQSGPTTTSYSWFDQLKAKVEAAELKRAALLKAHQQRNQVTISEIPAGQT